MSRRARSRPRQHPPPNSGYVLHHNAPQYFGYLADNPQVLNSNLHGAKDFFDAVEGRKLPPTAACSTARRLRQQ